jgi:hypothetical protein
MDQKYGKPRTRVRWVLRGEKGAMAMEMEVELLNKTP